MIPIVTTLATMNNIQRKKNGTENIHVGIAEHVSVSQLLPSDLFREGYYYYKVGKRNTIFGKLSIIIVSNDYISIWFYVYFSVPFSEYAYTLV